MATKGWEIYSIWLLESMVQTKNKGVIPFGAEALAKASIKNGVRRFVYVSTGAVYARVGNGVVDETSPRSIWGWAYSDAKLEAENLIQTYCTRYNLPAVIVQVAGVYGP